MTQLNLRHIGHIYPGDYPIEALKNINLQINQGEYVALVGPSGSGKSTLLNLLGLLDVPTAGTYLIDETEVGSLDESKLSLVRARNFGIIFQAFHLMDRRSVMENAEMGTLYHGLPLGERRQLSFEALGFVGLSSAAHQRVSTLSGGQRQRVAIARAITTDAPVILADEPTGNLDSESGEAVIATLEKLNATGTTVIIVTHDQAVAKRAERIITLKDGEIVSDERNEPNRCVSAEQTASAGVSRRYAKVLPRDMFTDILCGLYTSAGRTAGLIAAIVLAVAFALTTIGVAFTARYQVSDVFDTTINRRVSVSTTEENNSLKISLELARDLSNLERVRKVAGIEEAAAWIYWPAGSVSAHQGHVENIEVMSVVDSEHPNIGIEISDYPDARPLGQEEVLVGATAASQLGLGPVAAAPVISIQGLPYTVVGIIQDAGLRAELLSAVVINDKVADRLGEPKWAGLEIKTAAGAAKQVASQAAIAWMPTRTDLHTDSPPDPDNMREEIESSIAAILITLSVVSILAAVIALGAAMTGTVRRRFHEFGLRRTIGARRRHIAGIILIEILIISLLGGIVGTALSVISTLLVAIARGWQPVIEPVLLPAGVLLALIVGLLGSLSGAWQAARIQPADALRM